MKTFTTSVLVIFALISTRNITGQVLKKDKAMHLGVGTAIGAGSQLLAYQFTKSKTTSMLVGLGAGILAGVAKEMRDGYTHRGNVEVADALWTGVGGGIGALSFTLMIPNKEHKTTFTYH